MALVYLILGGNIGNTSKYLHEATSFVNDNMGLIVQKSSVYETEPWGFEHENNFLNQAIAIKTELNPVQTLEKIKEIEKKLGRERTKTGYEARTIDIDILFYNDLIYNSDELIIPHVHLHKRKFVLEPLNEIASDYFHPVLKQTIKTLLDSCTDQTVVKKID